MKKYLILMLTVGVFLASCKKYETQYGTETAATIELNKNIYEIAYSTEEGVFLVTAGMNRSKLLVSFANKVSPAAGRVALSPDRDKVAYVDPDNGIPIIIDTTGNVLTQLTQYPNTKDLGWHNGDKTLYILSNNQVHFYGEVLDLPSPLFVPPLGSNDYEVTTMDIEKNLDVVYGTVYYRNSATGNSRDWYYADHVNYKSPTLTDESNITLSISHPFTQNVAADSRLYYHTLRFFDLINFSYTKAVPDITIIKATAEKTASSIEFMDAYGSYGDNFFVRVGFDNQLFKDVFSESETEGFYSEYNASWDINMPSGAPVYVDWPPFF